jgi:hypothetical protein
MYSKGSCNMDHPWFGERALQRLACSRWIRMSIFVPRAKANIQFQVVSLVPGQMGETAAIDDSEFDASKPCHRERQH